MPATFCLERKAVQMKIGEKFIPTLVEHQEELHFKNVMGFEIYYKRSFGWAPALALTL